MHAQAMPRPSVFRHWGGAPHPVGGGPWRWASTSRYRENARFDAMVDAYSTMEVRIAPDHVPDAPTIIRELSTRYPLDHLDAIVNPGVGLREILDSYDLDASATSCSSTRPAQPSQT